MRRHAQIVVFALCLLPSLTHAQDRVLVVRADPVAEGLAEDLARRLVNAWQAEGSRVVRPVASDSPALPPPLDEARAEYHDLRPADAARRLEAWLAQIDAGAAVLDRATYVEALVWLALARLASGDSAGADTALARTLAVDPALELAEGAYPPTLRERVGVARGAATSATLRLESAPPGAEVIVDGEPRGETPLALELGVGPHIVHMSEPSHTPRGERITLRADGARVSWTLAPDPDRQLLGATGIDAAALAAARALGGALAWLDVRCGAAGCRARLDDRAVSRRVTAGPSSSAAELARALLMPPPIEVPAGTIEENTPDVWPWIVLGVGAGVAAIIATVVGAVFAGQSSGWTFRLEDAP